MRNEFKILTMLGLSLIGITIGNISHADTQLDDTNGESNTFIDVVTPKVDNFYLNKAPDFISKEPHDIDGDLKIKIQGSQNYEFVDLRGTGKGYHLQQKIEPFTATVKGKKVILPLKYFKLTVADSKDFEGSKSVDILGQFAQVVTAKPTKNRLLKSGQVTAELELDGSKKIITGDYQTTIINQIVMAP